MKIIHTFFSDNEGNVINSECKAIVHGKVFNCGLRDHFELYFYISKVEKRPSYNYISCTEIKEANMETHVSEA